jgi:hypothetical protein
MVTDDVWEINSPRTGAACRCQDSPDITEQVPDDTVEQPDNMNYRALYLGGPLIALGKSDRFPPARDRARCLSRGHLRRAHLYLFLNYGPLLRDE